MRRQSSLVANPFVMLTDPVAILQAVQCSERLNGLERRVCRPLDRPLIPKVGEELEQDLDLDNEADIAEVA